MRYEGALRHTNFVCSPEASRSTVAVSATLVRSNSFVTEREKTTGSIPLQPNPVVRDTTPNGGVGGGVPLSTYIMGAEILDVLQPCALRWFGKTEGTIMKVQPVSGQRSMRQLAPRMRFV
ncbi:hypothetical protein TNCV_155081 [Trichonephila clavipes]|uniref:Uncharacterized protein n=1 Tax=Trichonephila clavipes TaxID=2585209 RepID=A0A8X7BKU7_TRICX|nr:hypothetical protein TNCV_155081 [Trichonephila clavipes]